MVIWSTIARQNLRSIYRFIAEDSRYYAKRVVLAIVDYSEKLKKYPKLGRIVPELNNMNIRELHIYSYRLIYEITASQIQVLTLVHYRQNFQKDKK